MKPGSASFDAADRAQLRSRGLTVEEIERQLALFRDPPPFLQLVRPCTIGDGIRRLDPGEKDALLALHAGAAAAGRFKQLVPASGAATRMFHELLQFQQAPAGEAGWAEVVRRAGAGDAGAATLVRFMDELPRFAFYDDLRRQLGDRGEDTGSSVGAASFRLVLESLLADEGLGYARLPKGLLVFHRYPDRNRTAFEEHLVAASGYVRDAAGICRLHFTVSPEHRRGFEELFHEVRASYERSNQVRYEIGYSTQKSATDTVAADAAGGIARDDDGRMLLRPGGHGALIENLNDLQADLVYLRNIDNVQPDWRKPTVARWKRLLGGYLVGLQRRSGEILEGLSREPRRDEILDRASSFAGSRLQIELNGRFATRSPEAKRAWLIDRLSRPLRVCGVVPNTGEPGGGPFWVRDRDGTVSLQIVEPAQVDSDDEDQRAIWRGSTHFNPVDLVCGVRDAEGRPFDLTRFVNPGAVMISEKSSGGRSLRALERPGLWNGAMAGWNTVFVEVPLETFTPVKTVLDLLRPEHQPAEA